MAYRQIIPPWRLVFGFASFVVDTRYFPVFCSAVSEAEWVLFMWAETFYFGSERGPLSKYFAEPQVGRNLTYSVYLIRTSISDRESVGPGGYLTSSDRHDFRPV